VTARPLLSGFELGCPAGARGLLGYHSEARSPLEGPRAAPRERALGRRVPVPAPTTRPPAPVEDRTGVSHRLPVSLLGQAGAGRHRSAPQWPERTRSTSGPSAGTTRRRSRPATRRRRAVVEPVHPARAVTGRGGSRCGRSPLTRPAGTRCSTGGPGTAASRPGWRPAERWRARPHRRSRSVRRAPACARAPT
jgi:hypothetical protein